MTKTINIVSSAQAHRAGTCRKSGLSHPGVKLVAVQTSWWTPPKSSLRSWHPCRLPGPSSDHAGPQIDVVVVCSSTDTHAQMIEDAAAAASTSFVKSHRTGPPQDRSRAASGGQGRRQAAVGFNRRFDPSFKRVRDLVATASWARRTSCHHQSRPGPSADLVRQGLGAHFPGYGHPRF